MATNGLYASTLQMLRSDPRTLDEIAAGADVNRHWLEKLRQGRFKNPGVVGIEKLHDFLSQEPKTARRPRKAAVV